MSEKKKVISTIIQLRNEVEKLVGDAIDEIAIYNQLSSSVYSISESVVLNKTELKDKVEQFCQEYNPYEQIQRIVKNFLIMPFNKREWFIWNEGDYKTYNVKKDVVMKIFNKKQDYLRNSKNVSVSYTPKNKYGLVKVAGEEVFNSYQAPKWLENCYRYNKSIPVVTEVPEIYKNFLMHLSNGDEKSYNYILDWIAASLQSRNKMFLCTIGRAGIGKGVLANIIDALHGPKNHVMVEFSQINSNFTSLFNDKTFVYFNEANKVSSKELALMKMQNEETRKNEQKGVDAEMVDNYSNIYISSNNMDAFKLDSDDRRFSFINLTEKRLETVMTQEEISNLYPKKDAEYTWLNDFGCYLMRRPLANQHFTDSFKSEQTKRIKDASAMDWERWIIEDFCKDFAGRTITCRAVSEYASTIFKKTTVSEKSLRILSEKFKGVFKLVKTEDYEETAFVGNKPGFAKVDNPNGKRLSAIKINKLKEQTNHEVREVEND